MSGRMMREGLARVGKHASGMGKLAVVRWPLAKLKADPKNARRHPPASLAAIRASLQAFGQQKPIVITTDGTVVAGNGQLEAARALGWAELDVVVTQLTPDQAKRFAIADNRTAELSEWDYGRLSELLKELPSEDLPTLGFDAAALSTILAIDFDAAALEPQGKDAGTRAAVMLAKQDHPDVERAIKAWRKANDPDASPSAALAAICRDWMASQKPKPKAKAKA